jgi:hypothetical protein
MKLCTHNYCRCMRAAELAAMADRERNPFRAGQMLKEAIDVHDQEVPCREPEPQS